MKRLGGECVAYYWLTFISFVFWANPLLAQKQKYRADNAKVVLITQVETIAVKGLNNNSTSVLDAETGQLLFVVPVQSFRFRSAMVQKYFNYPGFTYSKKFPHIKFKGHIVNYTDLKLEGSIPQPIVIEGKLTVRGVTKPMKITGTLAKLDDQKLLGTAKLVVPDVFVFGIGRQEDTSFLRGTRLTINVEATYHKKTQD
ncbi:MAG TPA: hypothetical protein DCS93_04365 [Microscillaceae bacterium]|nr:hypothetical protein [Microscillaceae bacterium]